MEIIVKIIPHETQRYPTIGDWYFDTDFKQLFIMVSNLGNWKYHALIALHEQIEAMLCYDRGISEESVSAFDRQYEKFRSENDLTSEPGDSSEAPYYNEHAYATFIEKEFAVELGVDWGQYENAIYAL